MPRKTLIVAPALPGPLVASMRPRPDATENLLLPQHVVLRRFTLQ